MPKGRSATRTAGGFGHNPKSQATGDLLSLPLVQSTDAIFDYLGTFSVPTTIAEDQGVGSGGFNVSEDGDYLYINAFFDAVAKITVPAVGGSASLAFAWTETADSPEGSGQVHGTTLEYNGYLYKSKYRSYDTGSQSKWLQRGTTSGGSWTNLSSTSGLNMRLLSQGFYRIPSEWQSLLGGPCATLGSRLSIISNAQNGYGFAVFDPEDVGSNVAVTPLLNYPYGNEIPGNTSNAEGGNDLFSVTNAPVITAFIAPGSRSLLFITTHGYGDSDNGCRSGSSVHNDPNRVQVVAFDLADLVAVKNAEMEPYEVEPYAWWTWNGGGVHWDSCVGGVPQTANAGTYDPVRGRLYFSTDMFSGDVYCWGVSSL